MPFLESFSLPAFISDFPSGSPDDLALKSQWNTNITGWTYQAIFGNPWNQTYSSNQTSYYNPVATDIPAGTSAGSPIVWIAFPNRLSTYFGSGTPYNLSQDQIYELADTGYVDGESFQSIPTVRCPEPDWKGDLQIYGPYGPRGWQDEYCEWSVARDADNKIVRIDFACENPEYWNTLWSISPERVAELYTQTLNAGAPVERQITVSVEDLLLMNPETNTPVIDPSTGRPGYNPLNKWNTGPVSVRTGAATDSGGVMHLTSTPNTLQTEMGLAGAATVQRTIGNSDPQALICCAQYGQNFRNSDPHIGQGVNQAVSAGNIVALADPSGLYIQSPTNLDAMFSLPPNEYLPADAKVSDCWQILRGSASVTDPVTGQPFEGEMVLHAVFQIPLAWIEAGADITVSDITDVFGNPIQWAGQIVSNIHIGIFARPLPADVPTPQPCVGTPSTIEPQPLQLMHQAVWDAYVNTNMPNPTGQTMNLASNSTLIAPLVEQGATGIPMTLSFAGDGSDPLPTVTFPTSDDPTGSDITVTVTGIAPVNYAVPGNSYPSSYNVLSLTVDVSASATLGLRGVQIGSAPAAPALLNVVAAGTI